MKVHGCGLEAYIRLSKSATIMRSGELSEMSSLADQNEGVGR